jgi:hypothetical protein
MSVKYWRLVCKGKRPAGEMQSAVGRSGGTILRIHFEREVTSVYVAGEPAAAADAAKALRATVEPQEVGVDDVTKLS